MAPIKIKFVVSFSSQDKLQKVSNLLAENQKRWLSDPQDRTGQIAAIFQLERRCQLAFIDIGVLWCASIEVRVGMSDWPQSRSYVTLVPTQVLMSPIDSRLNRNTIRTCMFSKDNFTEQGAGGEWDRIQVVCRQLWRKDVQLGLSFLRIRSTDTGIHSSESPTAPKGTINQFNGSKPLGQKNTVADIQRHFFGDKLERKEEDDGLKQRLQKLSSTTEGGTDNPDALPRIARMVLHANKHGVQHSPPGNHDNGSRLFSGTLKQQQSPQLQEEVSQFLDSQNLNKEDIYSIKVSDLRHKFEKLKWRKLTAEENLIFYNCYQDFIGQMFDDGDGDTTTNASPVSRLSPCKDDDSSTHGNLTKRKQNGSASKSSHSPSGQKSSLNGTQGKKCRSTETFSDKKQDSDNAENSDADHRLSGGFLRTQFPQTKPKVFVTKTGTTPQKDGASNNTPNTTGLTPNKTSLTPKVTGITPTKTGFTPSKCGFASDKRATSARTLQSEHQGAVKSSYGSHTSNSSSLSSDTKMKATEKTVALSLQEKFPQFFPRPRNENRIKCAKGEKVQSPGCVSSPKTPGKLGEGVDSLSSPPSHKAGQSHQKLSNSASKLSKIDTSLLNTHRQFVNVRLKNMSSPPSRKPSISSTATSNSCDIKLKRPTLSDDPDASPSTDLSSLRKQTVPKNGSKSAAAKRVGSPLDTSETAPAKRKPGSVTSLTLDDSSEECDGGGWLNASRGPSTERGRQNCKSRGGRSQRGRKAEATPGDGLSGDSSPKASTTTGDRGRGCKRSQGQARGAAKRRLEMSQERTASVSDVATPSAASNHHNDPFFGELQIDEEAVFVECPLCQEMFPSDTVNLHAANCPGKTSPEEQHQDTVFVQCPLCEDMFPQEIVAEHASLCCM